MATIAVLRDLIKNGGLWGFLQDKEPLFDPNSPSWANFVEFYRGPDGALQVSQKQIRSEYKGLVNLSKKGRLAITPKEIRVPLGGVYKRDLDDKVYLGQFVIVYYPKKGKEIIKIVSLNPKLASNHSNLFPNSWSSDAFPKGACLGNIEGGLNKFIRQKEFIMATYLIIEFLEYGEHL